MIRKSKLFLLSTALLTGVMMAGVLTWAVQARAATADDNMKIWDGVYTAPQAARGKAVYNAYCEKCHGIELAGGRKDTGMGGGPPLKGSGFFQDWERQNVSSLMSKISGTMPLDSPASLRSNDYVDLIAYILSGNEYPTGNAELTGDAKALAELQIVRKAGTVVEAPSFALVQVVGCLTRGPDQTWILTQSTDPILTRSDALSASDLSEASPKPLGSQTFRLLGAPHFKPDQQTGRKVEAKGLLNRVPDNHIDLVALEPVGPDCN
jgi:quinoprotein glucose dehydrogenase